MAYQETEKTKARKEAQAKLIIASAIDIIKKDGIDGLTTRTIAERAGVAKGLIFHYFADMTELLAQIEHTVILRDIDWMHRATEPHMMPIAAFASAMRALFIAMQSRESREMVNRPEYSRAIAAEIEKLLRLIDAEGDRKLVARATLGAISQAAVIGSAGPKRQQATVLFVLRAIGVSPANLQKAMELV